MSVLYIDTSAAAKLVVREKESDAVVALLNDSGVSAVSSLLLETELRRFAIRVAAPQSVVTHVLDGIVLYDVVPSVYRTAGLLPGAGLRSLDALHLAAAVQIGVSAIVTYDARLADAAASAGLPVLAPT